MANTPTNNMSEIAHPNTYIGQNQPVGGAENLANPPTVIAAFPAGGSEIVGGALNLATPPTVVISPTTEVPIAFSDSASLDAFSRQRVSSPNSIFVGKFRFNKLPILFDEYSSDFASGTGTVTHIPNDACVQFEITATGIYKSPAMTSHQSFLYRSGQSLLLLMSFVANPVGAAMSAGVTKRIGYYDKTTGGNGVFLELTYDGSDLSDLTLPTLVIASTSSSGSESVPQSSWNVDPLNGTGPSGITINFNFSQILVIDLQFLGVGRVRWGFDIGGVIIYVHYSKHANISGETSTYMKSACLPVRCEIFGTNVNAKMNFICSSVIREGGEVEPSYRGAISTEEVSTAGQVFTNTATGLNSSLLAIRIKPTFVGAYINPHEIVILNTSNTQIYWEAIILRGLPTASALFTWKSLSDAAEYSVTQVTQANVTAALVDGIQIKIECAILPSSGRGRTAAMQSQQGQALQVLSANSANSASGGATPPSMDILLIRGRGMGGAGSGHVSVGIDEYY
jgi:hypothetical protein